MRKAPRVLTDLAGTVAVLGALIGPVEAAPGINDDQIVFGQSAAFKGPAKALGTGMRRGLQAAFAEVNASGGVDGRKIELVSYDDGYEPDAAIANTRKLIKRDNVFALIGEVGTPTSKAVQPIAERRGVPFVAPFTGASFLRADDNDWTINVRASYCQEIDAWTEYLAETENAEEIALLYQDDSYGRVGLRCLKKALSDRDEMGLTETARYPRNTTAVKRAFLTIQEAQPDAVGMVGAYKPVAKFIRLSNRYGLDVPQMNISFVGSKALRQALGDASEHAVISQVVPFPWGEDLALTKAYRTALDRHTDGADPGFVSLEGYIAGRLTIRALENIDGEITRKTFVQAFLGMETFEMDGLRFSFGPDDNQALSKVFLTTIDDDGNFEQIAEIDQEP